MAAISRIKPGQELWTVHRGKMGNTTVLIGRLYSVRVIEVNVAEGWVLASWNGNAARKYRSSEFSRWKTKKPEPKGKVFGWDSY